MELSQVLGTRSLGGNLFITRFRSPNIAFAVLPGQFVMVSFEGVLDPLLPRAFSVCDVSGEDVFLFYAAIGKGTRMMSELRAGDMVTMNGPLGRGFPDVSAGKMVWIVVGGSGMAVVPLLARRLNRRDAKFEIFSGARTESHLVHFDGISTRDATDDGSKGYHGTVVDLIKESFQKDKPDKLFACGPTRMLEAVQSEFGGTVPTYLSVEAPMACGMGFCQGCPIRIAGGEGYYLACKDGPVFRSDEIDFGMGGDSE